MAMNQARVAPVSARIRTLQFILIVAVSVVTFAALTLPIGLRPTAVQAKIGDVAVRDYQAPKDIEYVSEIRTEEARLAAEGAVQAVYTNPDSSIGRQQIEHLNTTLQLITSIRDDAMLEYEKKKSQIADLSDVRLQPDMIEFMLGISPARWNVVQQESLRVLEQVMRRAIHEEALDAAKQTVPALVSLALSEQQVELVTELVTAYIVPNSSYSEELTNAAKQSARDGAEPVVKTYKAGETIVPAGEVISPADMEAFNQLGMIQPGQRVEDTLGAATLTILSAVFVSMYFYRRKRTRVLTDPRSLLVITIVFMVFIIGARLAIPNRTVIPYLYPLPAAGLLLTTLFGTEIGFALSLVLSILAAYGLPNTLDLTPYYLFSSLFGLLALGPARRFWAFFRGGAGIAAAGMAVVIVYRLPYAAVDIIGFFTLIGAAIFNGLASASVALLLQYFLAQTLGLTTALNLLDISRPDYPLLQFFLRAAPGTYQHSLQVANLAEQAAERIGADPLLTRVGALFHDVGKTANPAFFIENQIPGNVDKHHDIAPEEAAHTIIRHVKDGVQMARKYRLPQRLEDFMLEHHGTLITRYQYSQAVEASGGDVSKVDIEKFRYPGPRPRSRETALLMLADAVEARTRAERPATDDDLRALIHSVVELVQKHGQLDDTLLTLRDLSLITESFATTLRGQYHPRIQYPNAKLPEQETTIPIKRKKT
jgi:putative nucleotidyltransferase with HDIG domain